MSLRARLLIPALLLVLSGCGGDAGADRRPSGGIRVFVSLLPQAFFVERVVGSRAEVEVLVQPGQSPATYSPTPRQMARLTDARALFTAGVPFERALLPRIRSGMKELRVVDLREGIDLRDTEEHEQGQRAHDGEHPTGAQSDHVHEAKDPHTWLNPLLVKRQCRIVRDALCELDPEGRAEYADNCSTFCTELDGLHAELKEVLAPLRGREIFVFHPAYGYFCEAYGLRQVAVEVEGKAPSARGIAELIDRARNRKVRVIFVQPQFSQKSARTLARAIGGAVVTMDPLARDYLSNMRGMAAEIRKALE